MSDPVPPHPEPTVIDGREQFVLVVAEAKTVHAKNQAEHLLTLKSKLIEAATHISDAKWLKVSITQHGILAACEANSDHLFRLALHLVDHPSDSAFDKATIAVDLGIVQTLSNGTEELAQVGPGVDLAFEDLKLASPKVFVVGQAAMEALVELGVPRSKFAKIGATDGQPGSRKLVFIASSDKQDDEAQIPHSYLSEWALKIRAKSIAKYGKDVASESTIRKRLLSIRRDTMLGIVLLFVALVAHQKLETTDTGQRLEMATYDWLMGFISPGAGDLPVTVVDFQENINISAKPGDSPKTNLDQLKTIVSQVLAHHPASVAIDLNFGPQPVKPGSPEMWYIDEGKDFVPWLVKLQKQKSPPIHLATTLAVPDDPAMILDQDALTMAVHCIVPSDVREGQVLMFKQINRNGHFIKSLPQAISDDYASAHGTQVEHSTDFLTPFVNDELASVDRAQNTNPNIPSQILADKFFINYADEDALKNGAVIYSPDHIMVDSSARSLDSSELDRRIKGKAVIIGSATTEGDLFTQPRTDAKMYGLYILALAADTRLHAPLYEFQEWFRIVLHILLGLVILVTVLGLRAKLIGHKRDLAASRLSLLLTFVVAGLTILAGIVLVRTIHVIWTDFFLGIFLLLLHPRVEHWIEHVGIAIKQTFLALWSKFVYNDE